MVTQLWLWRAGAVLVTAGSITQQTNVFKLQPDGDGEERYNLDFQLGQILVHQIYQFGKETGIEGIKFPPALTIFERSVVSVLNNVSNYLRTTKSSKVDYRREREFLHELSDIRSELAMIQDVFDQQKEVLGESSPEAKIGVKDDTVIADAIDRLITERLRKVQPTAPAQGQRPVLMTPTTTTKEPPSQMGSQ